MDNAPDTPPSHDAVSHDAVSHDAVSHGAVSQDVVSDEAVSQAPQRDDAGSDDARGDSAVTVIEEEHRALQSLFDRVSQPDEDRPEVLKQLTRLLSSHVAAEQQLLVPVLRERLSDEGGSADQLSEFHDEVERILVLLDRRKVNSPDVPGLVTDLLRLTEAHVAQADAEVLPGLRGALSDSELAELGQRMVSDERRSASHPHPHLPHTGPLGKITGEVASVVDRIRDRSADIGRSSG